MPTAPGVSENNDARQSSPKPDQPFRQPNRWLAEGRDASATIDSGLSDAKSANVPGASAYQNEGDNEITGIHVSDGDATVDGLLGAKVPTPFENGWRVFYTQQHGENTTWEVLKKTSSLKTASQ